jgi:hypothetical protein
VPEFRREKLEKNNSRVRTPTPPYTFELHFHPQIKTIPQRISISLVLRPRADFSLFSDFPKNIYTHFPRTPLNSVKQEFRAE